MNINYLSFACYISTHYLIEILIHMYLINSPIFGARNYRLLVILAADLIQFMDRDSAEASAEASVDLTEASVSAESLFTPIRSFTTSDSIFRITSLWLHLCTFLRARSIQALIGLAFFSK